LKLKEILKTKGSKVWSVKANQAVREALQVLVSQKIGALLVLDQNENVAGIITERDIMRGCYEHGKDLITLSVNQLMTKNVIVGSPEDDTNYIMGVMTQNRVRHIPVVHDGKLHGIVSIGDVVKSQLEDSTYEIRYLKEYIYGARQQE